MMKLLGSHQVVNAATAIGAVEALHHRGIEITSDAVREGVASARWEGRLEVVAKRPYIVLDGAQNRASAKALTRAIKDIFRYERLILALGVSRDKDIDGILKELLPIADRVILTKSRITERALDPARIRSLIPDNKEVEITSNVGEAIKKARHLSSERDLVLITGSLFVVGEARENIMGYSGDET
jgi:dihydrofolate synthase/folylpolyglutamate synthase